MKKYLVTIREVVTYQVEVTAETPKQAEDKAWSQWGKLEATESETGTYDIEQLEG